MNFKALIIDDDAPVCEELKNSLQKENCEVSVISDGGAAVEAFKNTEPDIVILGTSLPNKDGLQVCREIRSFSSRPIIIISKKKEIFDKVLALELGADDYVVKPFDAREVIARIKAILRRTKSSIASDSNGTVKLDGIEISLQKYSLKLYGQNVRIPPKELELLYFLASNFNRVFTRDQLLDEVWGYDYLGDSRTVDVHIKRIRDKINGISEKWELDTVWGVGYKFKLAE